MSELTTRKKKDIFYKALSQTLGNVSQAAEITGLSRLMHYQWMNNDPKYKTKVDELINLQLDKAEQAIYECLDNRFTKLESAKFILRYHGRSRGWAEKQELTITNKVIKFEFGDDPEATDTNIDNTEESED